MSGSKYNSVFNALNRGLFRNHFGEEVNYWKFSVFYFTIKKGGLMDAAPVVRTTNLRLVTDWLCYRVNLQECQ